MYAPFNYEYINAVEGSYMPSQVKVRNTTAFRFWERSLFQRACSVLEFDLPEEWQGGRRDFFMYCLYRFGFVAVFKNDKFGLSFQPATPYGMDFYYQPTEVLISNPKLSDRLKIGSECELLKLTPDFCGIFDIIDYYAEKLSTLDKAINTSLINNIFAYMIGAKSKAGAEALKKMLDKINSGEPAVIYDSKLLDDAEGDVFEFMERSNLKESYLTSDQLQDFQTLLNNFDTEIGIPVLPYAKKERMVTSEAESRIIDSTSRSTVWINTLKSSIKEIKKLYPDITLEVKARYEERSNYGTE